MAMDTSENRYIGIIIGEKQALRKFHEVILKRFAIDKIHMSSFSGSLKKKLIKFFLNSLPQNTSLFCITLKTKIVKPYASRKSMKMKRYRRIIAILAEKLNLMRINIDEVHLDCEIADMRAVIKFAPVLIRTNMVELADVVAYLNHKRLAKHMIREIKI